MIEWLYDRTLNIGEKFNNITGGNANPIMAGIAILWLIIVLLLFIAIASAICIRLIYNINK